MATPEDRMEESFKKCRHLKLGSGHLSLVLNPVVSIVSVVLIWLFVILCIAKPDHMLKGMNMVAFSWIPEVWTWFYIVSQDIWIVVLLYVMAISKYGNLKLGKDDEPPEYSFATWFSMLFSAGVAIGLFYYSVAEPVWHYKGWGGPRFVHGKKGYGNDNEDATHALMVTWFHWGVHGWIPYTTMGAVLGIMHYRRGFPMTIRYVFWPLIGERCYGWMGDCVDILSVMTTIFGVCTSLGLGAMQINQGMQRLNHGFYRGTNFAIPDEAKYSTPNCGDTGNVCGEGKESYGIQVNVETQITIIVVVTLCATCSVISGMNNGIVNLSRINFAIGMFLLLLVVFLGETYFCVDAVVQAFGYYLWYILKISFQTDAWERLGGKDMGLGGAPDEKGGSDTWLSGWTIFYWGWWISWGPFVGTFLARISKGRTLRQFILGTLIIPTLYSFLWFGIFGAEGIRMQRMADGSKVCTAAYDSNLTTRHECSSTGNTPAKCRSYAVQYSAEYKEKVGMGWSPSCVLDNAYHGGYGKCKEFAWTRMVTVGDQCVESTSWVDVPCGTGKDPTASSITNPPNGGACKDVVDFKMWDHFSGDKPSCFVPAQDNIVCLYNQGTTDIFFDLLASYGPRGFTDVLSVIGMVALLMYFVTSSDSGSLVVDIISANGHTEPPVLQRIFWSFTEGATACALLAAGRNLPNSDGSLKALQSCSMVTGLPYTFILFWCAQSLVLLCREETGVVSKDRKAFSTFILDVSQPVGLLMNTALPGVAMGKIIQTAEGWPFSSTPEFARWFWTVCFQLAYVLVFVFLISSAALYQWCIVGLVAYLGFATMLGFLRSTVRNKYRIEHGDLITDFICACFAPMFTLTQLEAHLASGDTEKAVESGSSADNAPAKTGNPDIPL